MTAVAGARRRGRELALQALYQLDVTGGEPRVAAHDLWRHFGAPEEAPPHGESAAPGGGASADADDARRFAGELVRGVLEMRARIDELIAASAEHWRLERLSQIDRNILRVGAFELIGRPDVPPSVAIDEAIEIAKRFGNEESPTFVNGVLDHIADVVGAKEGRGAP